MYELYIGDKNYSSWSLRPWLLMRHFGIEFVEHAVPIGRSQVGVHRPYSDSGLVPCLHDDGFRVWDSLAIAEYLAERHPGLWPADPRARARARSVSAEMHAGFGKLRAAMPMNIKLRLRGAPPTDEVGADIQRIAQIWTECRSQFGANAGPAAGPYLFGAFSIADAMYAPVVWRFETYNVALPAPAGAYRDTMLAHPGMQAWQQLALAEGVALAYDAVADAWGGPR